MKLRIIEKNVEIKSVRATDPVPLMIYYLIIVNNII